MKAKPDRATRSIFIGFFFLCGMVHYCKNNNIGIIEFNDPDSRVNLLSDKNLEILKRIIDYIVKSDRYIKALFFTSKKENIFIAGADIKELAAIRTNEQAVELCKKGQDLFNRIERLKVPTFAIVNGACVGGGLELALSCNYILATKNKKVRFGLPEVKLRIVPGFGGPHRLAEKIGPKKANYLINTGKLVNAKQAKHLNLVDGIISESEQFLYQRLAKIHRQRHHVASKFILPGNKNRFESDKSEREVLAEKILQEPARNSLSSYLLVSKYRNYSWLSGISEAKPIERCAVIGAGTMGRGIAYLISSKADLPVSLRDISKTALRKAKLHIKDVYSDAVKRGILDRDEARLKLKYISFGRDQLKNADIVVESITEDVSIKKTLFTEAERELGKDCILATNTSCISIEELSKSLKYAERFLGMHFFNPAYKMKLVEVVPTRFTNKAILQTALVFLKQLGRIPIIVKDSPGFLVNRIFLPYLNEAIFMLEKGFSAGNIERAMLEFGMPMGPLQLLEEIGPDVVYKASKILEDNFESRMKVPDALKEPSVRGRALVFTKPGSSLGHSKVSQDIVERLLYPMRREAELCLKEGIASNREIIDLVLLLGIGFPSSKRIWKK